MDAERIAWLRERTCARGSRGSNERHEMLDAIEARNAEIAILRAELERLKAAPVEMPELKLEKGQQALLDACLDEDDYPDLEDLILNGRVGALCDLVATLHKALASRLRTVQPGEVEELRLLLGIALDHVEASAEAQHLLDGFRRQVRPLDALVDEIRAVLRARPTTNEKEG